MCVRNCIFMYSGAVLGGDEAGRIRNTARDNSRGRLSTDLDRVYGGHGVGDQKLARVRAALSDDGGRHEQRQGPERGIRSIIDFTLAVRPLARLKVDPFDDGGFSWFGVPHGDGALAINCRLGPGRQKEKDGLHAARAGRPKWNGLGESKTHIRGLSVPPAAYEGFGCVT